VRTNRRNLCGQIQEATAGLGATLCGQIGGAQIRSALCGGAALCG
jgi:hypothetical protein